MKISRNFNEESIGSNKCTYYTEGEHLTHYTTVLQALRVHDLCSDIKKLGICTIFVARSARTSKIADLIIMR